MRYLVLILNLVFLLNGCAFAYPDAKTDKIEKVKTQRERPIENVTMKKVYMKEKEEEKAKEETSTKEKDKEVYLLATISPLKILPYTYEVAQLAGEIARNSGRPIEFADAAIAATAIVNNYKLYTLNKKHFKGIKELVLYD